VSGGKRVFTRDEIQKAIEYGIRKTNAIKQNIKKEREEIKELNEMIDELSRVLKSLDREARR